MQLNHIISCNLVSSYVVVLHREYVNSLAWGYWEFANDIYPTFHEWPWGDNGGVLLGWKVCYLGKALAAVAFLDKGDGVRPHSRPVVASC